MSALLIFYIFIILCFLLHKISHRHYFCRSSGNICVISKDTRCVHGIYQTVVVYVSRLLLLIAESAVLLC